MHVRVFLGVAILMAGAESGQAQASAEGVGVAGVWRLFRMHGEGQPLPR